MSDTVTLRVPKPLAAWLRERAARTGRSQSQIIKEQLERLRQDDKGAPKFMRLAGCIRGGPRNLSTRKGFAKP